MELTTTPTYLPVFASPEGEAEAMAAYQVLLDKWPVPFTELDIPTSFGLTHVIASGPEGAPVVMLLHALYASAVAWFPTAGALSQKYRVYAIDTLGEPNKSRPTRVIRNMDDNLQWFKELMDGLYIGKAYLVGNSVGGFCSLAIALHMPDCIEKMVLISPAATFRPMLNFYWHCMVPKLGYMILPKSAWLKKWMLDGLDWMANGAPLDPDWGELFKQYLLYGTGARMIFPRVFKPAELAQVKTPTYLLIGDKEVIYNPEKAIAVAKRSMPNMQSAVLPNTNHIAALSQPELVNEHIMQFLQA